MRTFFIENYLHFMKNCIRPHYEKLKPLKSGFIENLIFENNRDPCMDMNYYPLERNVCELKVGSSTYPKNRLQFLNGKERDRHAFEDQAFKDFAFKSHKICEEKMLV